MTLAFQAMEIEQYNKKSRLASFSVILALMLGSVTVTMLN